MITPTSIQRIAVRTYRYTVSGTAPFRAYQGGDLVLETSATTFDIDSDSNDMPPYVEILDATETTPLQKLYPATVRIQWRGVSGVDHYRIFDADDALVTSVAENGQGYYSFQAVSLAAGGSAEYTVASYDQAGALLGATVVTAYPVAHAAAEAYEHSVAAGVLTVGVAA